jgi:dTDP-4-amino-4,6-dideoxygalactose transaminase
MILMNDFKKEPSELREQELAAVEQVLNSGWYILGPKVEEFEKNWAQYLGAQHSVGVANGMDAIELGLRALDLPPGSEVVTTPMTAFATILAVLRAGLTPVLADIDPDTGIIQQESVAQCISAKTKAILLVHLYGRASDMTSWMSFARERGLFLLEDCAQAHGARWGGQSVGTFGTFAAWSFYPTKNLGAIGDGGAITTNDANMANKIRVLRNYGQSERYHHPVVGLNSRLDELQAAILIERLRWLDSFTESRRNVANAYWTEIANPAVVSLARPQNPENHVHHLFVVKSPRRNDLMTHLKKEGVSSLIHYPIPVHHQKPCADIKTDPQGLKACEQFAKECISLPIHPQLTASDTDRVISAVNSFK